MSTVFTTDSAPHGVPGDTAGQPDATGPRSGRAGRHPILASAAVSGLVAGVVAGGMVAAFRPAPASAPEFGASDTTGTAGVDRAAPLVASGTGGVDWAAVAAKAGPSVVAIDVANDQGQAQGSGVVWDSNGDIVTNNHVVSGLGGGAKISVRMGAQTDYPATVVGTFPATDLAVVKLTSPPASLTPIARGDVSGSNGLKVGDPVMALGNPLGLSGTVTTGIVSALNRPVTTEQVPPSTVGMSGTNMAALPPVVTDSIQTNAAINPGNSGGALVDAAGRLVGINSAIASVGAGGGGQSGNIGIGFAIPVREVDNIVGQLIAGGTATTPQLGVSVKDAAYADGGAQINGAGVAEVVAGSPAADAGVKTGDIVTAIDATPVDGSLTLTGYVRGLGNHQKITLTIHRDGSALKLPVTLAPAPAQTS